MPDSKQGATILVVEDDPNMQVLTSLQLEGHGYRVVVKGDGRSALAWLASNKADLVMLDLMLPGMDGIAVLTSIRQTQSPSTLPVLMVSALGSRPRDRVRGLEAGANDFIAKPYDEAELIARISVLLKVKGNTDRLEQQLSSYLASAIRAQAKLDPEKMNQRLHRHAVVLFADLRGFTRATAHSGGTDILDRLNEFFDTMMRAVDRHGGVVFDLIGDELLAAFNVPNDTPFFPTDLAVQAAIDMQELFKDLRSAWARAGLDVQLGLSIGIHQGDVVLGNIGGVGLMRYTVMGDVVNLAHRLVDLAGEGDIVISSQVHADTSSLPPTVAVEPLKGVKLKGFDRTQLVYRLSSVD